MSDDSFKIICHRCRAAVLADVEVCPECGNVLISRPAPRPPAPVAAPVAEAGPSASASAAGSAYVAVPDTDFGELYRQIAAGRPPSVSAASYAGFWTRFIAWMIDTALIVAVTVGIAFAGSTTIAGVVYIGAFLLYYPLMEASSAQGTIGKLLCGVAVTDLQGRRISYPRSYARLFGRFLCSLTGGLGYLLIPFTSRKQGLHDLVAETLVLNRGAY